MHPKDKKRIKIAYGIVCERAGNKYSNLYTKVAKDIKLKESDLELVSDLMEEAKNISGIDLMALK